MAGMLVDALFLHGLDAFVELLHEIRVRLADGEPVVFHILSDEGNLELARVFLLFVGVELGDGIIADHRFDVALGEVFEGKAHFVIRLDDGL